MNGLTLDKLAEQAGLEIDAVQLYERLGFIKKPTKAESNQQFYMQEKVSRLRFVKRAQSLGFSLNEIKELLFLRNEPHATKKDIKSRTLIKIKSIENKMLDLFRIKGVLEHLASTCDGQGPVDECPILEALDPNTQERLGWRHDHHGH